MQESFEIKENTPLFDSYRIGILLISKNKKYRRIYYFILIVSSVLTLFSLLSPKTNWLGAMATLALGVLFPLLFIAAGMFVLLALLYLIKPDIFRSTFFFDHWGMRIQTKTKEHTRSWNVFTKWEEKRKFFLLFISEHEAHIITKKNMSEADIPEFRRFLGERIGLF